jgi:hypothetical protein
MVIVKTLFLGTNFRNADDSSIYYATVEIQGKKYDKNIVKVVQNVINPGTGEMITENYAKEGCVPEYYYTDKIWIPDTNMKIIQKGGFKILIVSGYYAGKIDKKVCIDWRATDKGIKEKSLSEFHLFGGDEGNNVDWLVDAIMNGYVEPEGHRVFRDCQLKRNYLEDGLEYFNEKEETKWQGKYYKNFIENIKLYNPEE